MTIDIHGMIVVQAKKVLEKAISSASKDTKEIIIIHGYSQGDALKTMVRDPNQLRSNRIKRRKITKNPGETILELYV